MCQCQLPLLGADSIHSWFMLVAVVWSSLDIPLLHIGSWVKIQCVCVWVGGWVCGCGCVWVGGCGWGVGVSFQVIVLIMCACVCVLWTTVPFCFLPAELNACLLER